MTNSSIVNAVVQQQQCGVQVCPTDWRLGMAIIVMMGLPRGDPSNQHSAARTPLPFCFSVFSFFVRFSSPFCRSPRSTSFFARFVFSSCRFSVCFLYRLPRFSFRFPVFLGGGFCYSVISSWRYTTPAILARLTYTYEYSPCVLSSLLRSSCWLSFFFFFSFPFFDLFDFDLDIVCFILSFSCGYYAVSSVSVSAETRWACDMYLDTYVRTSPFYCCLRYAICFSYCVYCVLF